MARLTSLSSRFLVIFATSVVGLGVAPYVRADEGALTCIPARLASLLNGPLDHVVIVSGGTEGIGLELVKRLYDEGKKVATFARTSERIEELRRLFPDANRFHAEVVNLVDHAAVNTFVNRVEQKFGPVTQLVNNAGMTGPLVKAGQLTPVEMQEILMVNTVGTAHLTALMVEKMSQRGIPGVIVNVSSGSAKGVPGLSVYAASKSAVNTFTKTVAKEYRANNVSVFSFNPGHVDTRLQRAAGEADPSKFPSAEAFKKFRESHSVRNPIDTAEEIAYVLKNPQQYRSGSLIQYSGVARKLERQRSLTTPAAVIFNEAEAHAARAEAKRLMLQELDEATMWSKFEPIQVDETLIAPPKDLIDLDTRVLKSIHRLIAESPRPIVRLRIHGKHFAVEKTPVGEGMAGAVYAIADSKQVIKISKPMPLSLLSMLEEKGRAKIVEGLASREPYITPKNFEFDAYGIYGVKERVNAPTLTDALFETGVLKLVKTVDGKPQAVLAKGAELEKILQKPEVQDLQREIMKIMDIRARNPDWVGDLGPANLLVLKDPATGKVSGLSHVDIGLTSQKTKARFDAAYAKGFAGYLEAAEVLANRYIDTGVMSKGAGLPPAKAAVVFTQRKSYPKFSPPEEKYLTAESQNDYPITTAVRDEFLPGEGRKFSVKYLLVPESELHVVDSGLGSPELRNMLFETKDGKRYVRFAIHPESETFFKPLIEKYGVAGEYEAGATASTRVVLAHEPNGSANAGQLKLSLAQYQSKRGRVIPDWEVRRSVRISEMMGLTAEKEWMKSGASIIPEVAGVYIPEKWNLGFHVDRKQPLVYKHGEILRDVSFLKSLPDQEIIPLFSIFARRGSRPPLIVELWKKSGTADFHEFVDDFLFKPFLEKNRKLMFEEGVIPEIHSQNLVIALDPKTNRIAHFFHRDVGSMKVDLRLRWINGKSVKPLVSENAAFDFKFERAPAVVDEAFMRYFHDESFVRGYQDALKQYVPGFDAEKTRVLLKNRLETEIQKVFPLKKRPDAYTGAHDHLLRYYGENQPKFSPVRIPSEPAVVKRIVTKQLYGEQTMELPEAWAKTLVIPPEGYLITDYGVVFRSEWAGVKGKSKLMLSYHPADPQTLYVSGKSAK